MATCRDHHTVILALVNNIPILTIAVLRHPRVWYLLVKLNFKKSWSGTKPSQVVQLLELFKTHLPVCRGHSSFFLLCLSLHPLGDFGTAIETLVTAVSLIRQSKIATDDRCKILISSLQDTLKGIEDKSYGQRSDRCM